MGATNHTPNYNLPQFIGTDKPTWLSDVNGAFSDIDTQMKANATSAAQGISDAAAADSTATAANNKANTLDTQINTPSTGLAAVVSGHTTDISSINSAIGSTVLPTTAQTLTGAIDEIYNDTHPASISYQSQAGDTQGTAFAALAAQIDYTKLTSNSYLKLSYSTGSGSYYRIVAYSNSSAVFMMTREVATNNIIVIMTTIASTCVSNRADIGAGSTVFSDNLTSSANQALFEIVY